MSASRQNAVILERGTSIAALTMCLLSTLAHGRRPLDVRVVVLTTFDAESKPWVDNFGWTDTLDFKVGGCIPPQPLRWNAASKVLHCCTGMGPMRASASVTALGLDNRLNVSQSRWLLAGIGGADPKAAPLAGVNWASFLVDGDHGYYIDPREPNFPAGWGDGWLPFAGPLPTTPYAQPPPQEELPYNAFRLSTELVGWAFSQTRSISLPDSAALRTYRDAYSGGPYEPMATSSPHVVSQASLATSRYWAGALSLRLARTWTHYWSQGAHELGSTAEEETGVYTALTLLASAERAMPPTEGLLVLRGVSNFCAPPEGITDIREWLSTLNPASDMAVEAVYQVGAPVVRKLAAGEALLV